MNRLVLLSIVTFAVACKDPCSPGGGTDWAKAAQAVENAIGAATNPFYTPSGGRAYQCAPSAPAPAPEAIGEGDACLSDPSDDACIACLKRTCCTDVVACDADCFDAAADAAPRTTAVMCGTDNCHVACGGAS